MEPRINMYIIIIGEQKLKCKTVYTVFEVGVNISFFSESLVSTQLDEILLSVEGRNRKFVVGWDIVKFAWYLHCICMY